MSYILESLKKSDKERYENNPQVAPVLANAPQYTAAEKKSALMLVCFFVGVVFLLVVLAALYFSPVFSEDIINSEPIAIAVEPSELVTDEKVIEEKIVAEMVVDEAVVVQRQPKLVSPQAAQLYSKVEVSDEGNINQLYKNSQSQMVDIKQQKTESKQETIVEKDISTTADIASIFELERSVQNQIPVINYDAHIYASDQRSGFVILNGVKRRVGEKMRNGIYVERIDKNHLVLSYQGIIFSLQSMQNWQP